jgi:NAD(P)-dependent dehydrogenase (short-subunit alcohol dehydrogenase family)
MEFQDRSVIITGGTGALGSAVVGALLEAGASCHIPVFNEAELAHFPHRAHPKVATYPGANLTDEGAVTAIYTKVPQLWASIHIAGGFAAGPVTTTGKAVLMGQVDTNLVTTFLCCRAACVAMAGRGGRIVNVTARPGLEWRTGAGMVAYAATKAAVAALTVALAQEVVKDGILVNAIAPSTIDTPANRKSMPDADHASWPKPAEIAQTILFLASPANQVTRGAIVPVYGKV